MSVDQATGAFDVHVPQLDHGRRRLIEWMLLGAPLVYAVVFNLAFHTFDSPFNSPDNLFGAALLGVKLLAIAGLVLGLNHISRRVAQRPRFSAVAAAVWASIGVGLVLAVAWAKDRGVVLGVDQLWPGQVDSELLEKLSLYRSTQWQPANIIVAEAIAVVALAVLVAGLLRLLAAQLPRAAVTASAMVALFLGLVVYDALVGWPVVFDFDPFVGDAVLGATTYELGFFMAPFDALGALSLGTIGFANLVILAVGRQSQ